MQLSPFPNLDKFGFGGKVLRESARAISAVSIFIGVSVGIISTSADAHVKWFSTFDVSEQPRALAEVSSATFWLLTAFSILVLWIMSHVERTAVGTTWVSAIDRLGDRLRPRIGDLLRAATAIFSFLRGFWEM
jgi:hypothetical protein